MNTTELFTYSPNIASIWDCNDKKWITPQDNITIAYGILFGDPGGDTFLKKYTSEEEFKKALHKLIILGQTGCDFAIVYYVFIKEGVKYTPTII